MSQSPNSSIGNSQRLGLSMVVASLIVIAVISGLLFFYQQEAREREIRSQGVSLARLLSEIPYAQLVPHKGQHGILQIIYSNQSNPDFAYGIVLDTAGDPVNEIAHPGVIIPVVEIPATPSAWLGERELTLQGTGQSILEFHVPVIVSGKLMAYVRLGYFKPGFGLTFEQIPFFATLALPIFLLTPLFYFLIKREIGPLIKVNNEIQERLDANSFQTVEIHASGELGDFMQRFNRFITFARDRIDGLESQQSRLLTSTKILSYKRARVESVLQSLPEAVIVIDESGLINYANTKLTSLLGVALDQVIGHKPSDWCENQDVLAFLSRFDGKGAKRYAAESLEYSPETAPEKTIQIKAYPLFSPKDIEQIFGILIVFRDVTIETLAKKSRGEFVAHVAHELKTPLNVLAMYSEALQGEDGESQDFRIEAVNVIKDEVERLSMLINNLLSITKIEMGSLGIERHRVKLRELLQDCFETVSRSAREQGIKFLLDLPREMSPVLLDKDLLRIAINNLLTNAIKYNLPGGQVTLSAEETEQAVRICIRDTGIGIAPKDQQYIFDKFYRSNSEEVRNRTGHGLGLSLTKDIVQLHQGQISINSNLGEGAEFIIELGKGSSLLQQAV